MTQLLIDRSTLEQIVRMLEQCLDDAIQVQCDLEQGYSKSLALAQMVQVELSKEALTAGRAALANAEPTGWIAAKDRMPPPQVRVLGFEPQYNIVDVDMWFGPDFNWGYSYWMPLPAAPKATP